MTTSPNPASPSPSDQPRPSRGSDSLDVALRAALAADPQPDTLATLIADSLRGQSRTLAVITLAAQLAAFLGAVASAIAFFAAQTTRDQILDATLFLLAMNAVGMIKAWFWMQLHRNRALREIKRLELQVARLADGLQPRP